jgi:anti-sigma factor RsiW
MNMNEDSWKVNAFIDGELDLARQLEIEQRMEFDDALRRHVDSLRALSVAVRDKADRHEAPAALRDRISALGKAARPQAPIAARRGQPASAPLATALAGWLGWRPLVTSMAVAAVLAVTLNLALLQSSRQERLMDEAVASHVRSTVGPHLVDVLSRTITRSSRSCRPSWVSRRRSPSCRWPARSSSAGASTISTVGR